MLNLFEVAPAPNQVPALIRAASAWYAAFPRETELWVDHRIGQRFCNLIDATRADTGDLLDPGQPLRRSLDVRHRERLQRPGSVVGFNEGHGTECRMRNAECRMQNGGRHFGFNSAF